MFYDTGGYPLPKRVYTVFETIPLGESKDEVQLLKMLFSREGRPRQDLAQAGSCLHFLVLM